MSTIKLTEYSHSAGCGCKIAPDVLEKILHSSFTKIKDEHLIVGNDTKDDAAVYDLGNGNGLISTVDFFMPIVDDAFQFGQIAAANSISDVYAMGGKPILATAILGWPVSKLPPEVAKEVIAGAREKCKEAGIALAGGHSVDALEPMFGLSVNGTIELKNLKRNSTCQKGDLIYITKKIGVGILATALKRGVISEAHKLLWIKQLTKLNDAGTLFGKLDQVSAMTDITGFGLIGHLVEMLDGADLSAELNYEQIPLIDGVAEYASKMIVPDNLYRNWNTYEKKVTNIGTESFFTLNDPQTNGGLMVTVRADFQKKFETILAENDLAEFAKPIGKIKEKGEFRIYIQ